MLDVLLKIDENIVMNLRNEVYGMRAPKPYDIEYIAKLLFESFKVPVKFIDSKGKVLYTFTSVSSINPLYSTEYFSELINQKCKDSNIPFLAGNQFLENFIMMSIETNGEEIGKFIIGPSISRKLPEEVIDGLLHDFSKITGKQELIFYYESLPEIHKDQLLSISKMLFFLLYNERLDSNEVKYQQQDLNIEVPINLPELEVSRRREEQSFHPPEFYEIEMLQCIREGRKEDLLRILEKTKLGEGGILAKKSYVRSQKNLAICGITLATRAAIEGGLEWDFARTLSDVCIQNIEDAIDVDSVNKVRDESFFDLAERVQKSNQAKYSEMINQSFRYIYKHLYDNISITQIADFVGVSPVHLSSLFKKEVGQTLKNYIQQEKIEEAKKLIILTDTSFLDISVLLNFNDQSYFTKVFRKVTGLTPKQYKDRGNLI
ncbi:AraC family transcriptional regulator [Metabacillus halosaccharovorans]|uniref:AraC family transcriptional regulator n=1 Tax=Metabacillus halosaccharovorans TaxID=930124 RepID=UPI00203EFDB0|nr:AraC family transcriptional regulator [Metabacillus halosaccharovorans]MCM3440492.1 AraC family transcriptional regulator [Metabacillus halosaccharovorans]